MNKTTNRYPEAFLSFGKNKNRLKVYPGKTVYMKDGTEFQIELYNPTTKVIGAKIYINGSSISNALFVIKPGERSYLERFIDENKKFLFETYNVENSQESRDAISQNGLIKVEFFKEKEPDVWNPTYNITTTLGYNPGYWNGTNVYYTNTMGTGSVINPGTILCGSTLTTTDSYSSLGLAGNNGPVGINGGKKSADELETGRVEMGAASGQELQNYYGNFETYAYTSVEYKILPESSKPIEINKIRQYCGGCGTRIKKASHRFCSQCGTEL